MRNKMRNKIKKNRWISWILTLAMLCSLLQTSAVPAFAADAAGGGVDISNAQDLDNTATEVISSGTYKISGARQNPVKITAQGEVVLVLDGVTITTATSPIELADGAKITLVVKDNTTNLLTCTATTVNAANSGKTAGILVPETASLTIDRASGDTGTGTLTVTGGYGGAGIGGAATQGYTDVRGAKGTDGGAGSDGAWNVADIKGTAGAKGIGGQGGFYGQSATNAGTITINAGTVNAIGGQGGAGIGGGRGGDGENGQVGNNGTSGTEGKATRRWNTGTYKSQRTDCGASGSAGGGGAGGNGGNGGAGGNGGVVAIKGGTVTAEGKDGAAGIGGGAGGNGGNGGNGGSGGAKVGNQNPTVATHFGWSDVYWYPGFGGAGGNGAGGYGGTGGAGGAGGQLTITGGKVQSNGYTGFGGGSVGAAGTKGNGTQTNGENSTNAYFWYAKGGSNSWSNQYYGHWYGNNAEAYYSRAAGPGGNGGAAGAKAQDNSDGAAGTMQITNSNANVDFVSTGGDLTNGRPTDKNKDPLYRVELTIYDLDKNSKIKDASVNVEVPGGNGKTKYTYKTVSENNGKAVLWLPAGDYTLSDKAVNHATLGAIPKDSPVTFTVAANNDNKQDVMIGVSVKVTADKTDKVYFSNDIERPVTIRVDTSDVEQIDSVKWFREVVNLNDQEYAPENNGNKESFDKRYGEIADASGNKGTLINPTNGVYSLLINQNGRYWVQVEYESNGVKIKLVKGLTINNIFRTFNIQFRSQWWESVGQGGQDKKLVMQVPADGSYGKTLNAQGKEMTQQVGFAWDLDGYNASALNPDNLLDNPYGDFDKVKFYAQSAQLSYNTAALGTHNFTKDALLYEKTMDATFLSSANTECDEVGGAKDYSKYTMTYEPKDSDLTLVTIYGRVQENGIIDETGEPLYTSQRAYSKLITEDNIKASAWSGYKLVGVRINGQAETFIQNEDGTYSDTVALTNIQGTVDKDKIRTVEFIYENNMTEVTIHGYYQGTTESVFDDRTVSAEMGKSFTYPQPNIDGYDHAGADPAGGRITSVTKGAEITFYYLKSSGNVTYQAVDADGNTLLATKTDKVANGSPIPVNKTKANDLFSTIPYYTFQSGQTTHANYNGKDDVTVTFTYTRNKHNLTIFKKDVDNGNEIAGAEQIIQQVPAGQSYVFQTNEVTTPNGYTPVTALNPAAYSMEDADGQTVFWYRKNDTNRIATVTVECLCNEDGKGEKVFKTYQIPAIKDVKLPVAAPQWEGYILEPNAESSIDIMPNGDATHDTVQFHYVLDNPRTITVKLQDTAGTALTAPSNYPSTYRIKMGGTVYIQAPVINGYSLKSSESILTVSYNTVLPAGDDTVTFEYESVSSAEFVTHTVKFQLNNTDIYQYEKPVPRGSGTTTYDETSVQMVIPGYKLLNIVLETGNTTSTDASSVNAPNDQNATIIYHFAEDAAKIVIKQTCTKTSGGHGTKETTLTGYRVGQENIVVLAPPLDDHVLAPDQPLFHKFGSLTASNEVEFKYDGVGDVVFELYEYDSPGVGSTVIQRINGVAGTTYNPTETNDPLNLTSIGYELFPCDLAHDDFKESGSKKHIVNSGDKETIKVYYRKITRPVQFYAIDSAKYPKPADMTDFDLAQAQQKGAVINGSNGSGEILTHETARVKETYKASAMNIDFYALQDDPSKYYYVKQTTDLDEPLKVYFWYRAKGSEDVTVSYQAAGQTILSYTVTATKGEKLALKAPAYLEDGKYKRAADQEAEITVTADAAKTVTLKYQPNFVNVTVQTVTDGGNPSNDGTYQVNKTDDQGTSTGNLRLIPPYKPGYTLAGIQVGTEGGQNRFPAAYDKLSGNLSLTGLQADTSVVYYYQTTKASEYQGRIKIQYQYHGYDLTDPKNDEPVNLGESNRIDIPSIDGYTAQSYTFVNGTGSTTSNEAIPAGGLQITPTAATGLTLTIHYTRTDGSVVLPGKDNEVGPAPKDQDNVIVKPDPTKPPTIDGDGNVTIKPDDKDASVIRPIDPNKPDQGKEEIKVPGGTVIKPDGTIELPNGGEIKPENKLPDAVPEGYRAVVYKANGGVGDDQINIYRNDETIRTITNPFTNGGKTFTGWSTAENGVSGTNFGENAEVTGITGNVTLYAQWGKKNTDGSVELPGKDGILAAPNDKDNVIVTPDKPNGTLNGPNKPDGNVKVETGEATVTRPDPTDPNFPEGGKEEIKVPDGSIIYPDGTIKLPDGTTIEPGDKLPNDVISDTYAIVTYEPNGGSGNVIRQMVKKNEAGTALSGDVFTAPRGMIFEQWKNVTEDQTIAAGEEFTPTKDLTLKAQWKEKAQTPTSYSAQIVFVSNTNDGRTRTQTITATNSKILTGKLDAYPFNPPAAWKFMGWSTAKAASQNAAFYADEEAVTLQHGDTLTLYAILYKLDDTTGVVTLPGKDGEPNTSDDVTVTPPNGGTITPGNGFVTAPSGSEIQLPSGNKVTVTTGPVQVYPDGSVYVPEGSTVKDKDGSDVTGPAVIKPDGSKDDTANTKPMQKPDGTIILPGPNGTIGTGNDDITVKPNGGKPAGRIDETTGNVTITDPDGADVTFQGKDPENVKLPIGTVITPNGEVTLTYTLKYVDDKGKDLEAAELVQIKLDETKKVKALSINGYNLKGEAVKAITGTLSTALNDYIITFTYEKQKSDGGSGGSGGAGGGGGSVIVIGGGGGGSSLNPQKPTIITDGNLKYTLSKDGSSASLTPNDGYEINSIIVNGEEKGGAEAITGLKTGDIVKISAICYLDVSEEAQSYKLAARSKQIKRKNGMHPVKVKVTWYDENGKELKLDGYEIERSRKRYSGYQLRFKTDREVYYNTYIENGAKYYYRVRGYILFKGEKYYTNWSKKAWRTVKM